MLVPLIFAIGLQAAGGEPPAPLGAAALVSDRPDRLAVFCDPKAFRFSIRIVDRDAALDGSYPRLSLFNPDELNVALPGEDGAFAYRGSLVRYARCGPYTIKVEGSAYNTSVQGQGGAFPDFAAVSVLRRGDVIYPVDGKPVRITECDRLLLLTHGCASGYAVRVDGAFDAARGRLIVDETNSSISDENPSSRQIRATRIAIDDNLNVWRGAPDD